MELGRCPKRRTTMRRTTVAIVIALLVTACGSHQNASDPTRAAHTPPSTANQSHAMALTIPAAQLRKLRFALRAWATFPVNASVRALVLTSDRVSAPAFGFPTVDAKEAFLTGLFITPSALPLGPRQADGYPVVTASNALAVMRAEGTPAGGAPRPPTPLVITSVHLGTSSFGTDRGTRVLPAWLFSFEGVQNPAAVLAVAASARFSAPADSLGGPSVGARLAADNRTVTITFVGARAGHGPCTADYTVDQLASNIAVAVSVRETRREIGTCDLVGYPRQQTIVLAAPLGNRVL